MLRQDKVLYNLAQFCKHLFRSKMTTEYQTYKRRWGVLATVMITNFTCFTETTCYLAVAARAAEYFDADDDEMDYFSLVGIIFTAPGMLVALYVVNKIGLKVSY